MKKRSEETQTPRAGCSKAEPKIFAPPQTPSRGAGWPKCNQLEMVTTFTCTNPVWWGSMHAISSYRGNRPTHIHKHTPTHTQTWPITIHCAAVYWWKSADTIERLKTSNVEKFTLDGKKLHTFTATFFLQNIYTTNAAWLVGLQFVSMSFKSSFGFPVDLCTYGRTVWRRTTKYSKVTHEG